MKKSHLYITIIVLLSVLNIFQLIWRFSEPKPKGNTFFDQLAAKEMNLNAEQKVEFANLTKKHKTEIDALQNQQKKLIGAYFNEPNDSLMLKISKLEQAKIKSTNTHFSDIKSILKPNQYSNFEEFKSNAVNHILRKSDKKKPPMKK